MRQTRTCNIDSNQSVDSTEGEITLNGPPLPDLSYERKFVVAKENTLANSSLCQIRHPKNGSPCIYRIDEVHCEEVVTAGETIRSWFYGDSVISDGTIRIMSPIHPIFLALPYFMKFKAVYAELDEILRDPKYPSIAVLIRNEQFSKNIDMTCDSKEVLDTKVYRFNENKALEWLSNRFCRLREALKSKKHSLHMSIINDSDVLDRYTFGILCDYINPELAVLAKKHLCIKDQSAHENAYVDMSIKRKAEVLYDGEDQQPVKKSKESAVMKKLQQASKGTKSISNFFTKKV